MNKIILITLIILCLCLCLFLFYKYSYKNLNIKTFIKQNKPIQKIYLEKLYNKFLPNFFNNKISHKINSVDRIYCITMPQRRKYIMNELSKLDTNIVYFDAITPKDLNSTDYNTLSTTFIEGSDLYNKITKLPVQLSFTMCFLDALKYGYENIIIFEDDITVETNRYILENSLKEFKKSDFSIFYLGYCLMDCKQNFDTKKYNYLVNVPDKKILCNHSIAFKTKYLHKLLDIFYPMTKPNDNLIINFLIKNKLKVCVPKKVLFNQNRIQLGSFNENPEPLPPTCIL